MPSTPLWKLRRLASRAKDSPAVAAYGPTLLSKVDAFVAAYDAAAKYEANWRKEMSEGKGAVAALVTAIRSWLPLIARNVPGFDTSTLQARRP